MTLDVIEKGNVTRTVVGSDLPLKFLDTYAIIETLGRKGDYEVNVNKLHENEVYFVCGIGLKDKKLALIICNYNNWDDTNGKQSNSKLCDKD